MGLFDRFSAKKPTAASSDPAPATPPIPANEGASDPAPAIKPRLGVARDRLEAKDLEGAVAIYEELLATAGDRADVLVTISGDLGVHGHVAEIIELIAPRYDAERHGPATGLNLLQAYLAARETDAAQHILDVLFALNRPELEERLHGFSNAIAELLATGQAATDQEDAMPATVPKVGLVNISKPIWYYGLESLAAQILPPKEGRLRRIAFAQLSLPGAADLPEATNRPEDELGRLSRAVPLWFAETFYFTTNYAPVAALGIITPPNAATRTMLFAAEWSTENLRQLVDTTEGGLDYIVTGALRVTAGDYELVLRVFEVKTFRERKKFTARWTPATADAALSQLHGEIRRFMEWSPASAAVAYTPPSAPRAWLETIGASIGLFLAGKSILPLELLAPAGPDLEHGGQLAASGEIASLAYLTLRHRAASLGLGLPPCAPLARSTVVQQARQALG